MSDNRFEFLTSRHPNCIPPSMVGFCNRNDIKKKKQGQLRFEQAELNTLSQSLGALLVEGWLGRRNAVRMTGC